MSELTNFEVGQVWETRGGQLRKIHSVTKSSKQYPIQDENGTTYSRKGQYYWSGEKTQNDLIRLVSDNTRNEKPTSNPAELFALVKKRQDMQMEFKELELKITALVSSVVHDPVTLEVLGLLNKTKE